MSKITNDGLTWSCKGMLDSCTRMAIVGVKGLIVEFKFVKEFIATIVRPISLESYKSARSYCYCIVNTKKECLH